MNEMANADLNAYSATLMGHIKKDIVFRSVYFKLEYMFAMIFPVCTYAKEQICGFSIYLSSIYVY